jgi:hypothetical protein
MASIGKVPADSRPVYSGMMAMAHSLDHGRSLPWRRVGPDAYILEEPVRPRVMATDVGSSAPVAAPESRPKKSAASAIWPNLP